MTTDCEEVPVAAKITPEVLLKETTHYCQLLGNAFSNRETDEELTGNPQRWVNVIAAALKEADCILKKRGDYPHRKYPRLNDEFDRLERSREKVVGACHRFAAIRNVNVPSDFPSA